MKSRIITILALFILTTASNCEKYIGKEPIQLANNSSDTIYIHAAVFGVEHIYPDTALPKTKPSRYVPPHKRWDFISTGTGGSWERSFTYLPSDTLSIYLFSADTLRKYSWQQIRDDYNVLKRFDLSLQDLKVNDFTITYP